MTQIPDPTRSEDDRRRQVPYFRIPARPIRQPIFSNVTNVNFMNGSFFLDFAYVDPYQLGNPENEVAGNGRPIIDVTPLVRLALPPEVSLPLYLQLGEQLSHLGMLPTDERPSLPDREPST